jgi:16S rRNA (uracil1498-N3)-methyltransferase
MRLTRIYTDQALQTSQHLKLHPMASAHLIKVLRLREGAEVMLFNGDGCDYRATIVLPRSEACELSIGEAHPARNESPCRITLLQGLCRGEKMDWVLEKATELGVHRIIPVHCERSEVHLDSERAEKRRSHWSRVVLSACEQSGRATVPELEGLSELSTRLTQPIDAQLKLALHPNPKSPAALPAQATRVAIAIGPEGGFSERDLAQLNLSGFTTVAMGARVLRTETAGPAAIAVLQSRFGDFFA